MTSPHATPSTDRDTIAPATRGFIVMVIFVIASYGILLCLFPGIAGNYWAWTVAEPRTSLLIGCLYLVPVIHYSLLLREREWIKLTTTLRSLFLISAWLTVVAMFWWSSFYPWRPFTLVWLFSYYLPLFFVPVAFRLQTERFGPTDGASGPRIALVWRGWLKTRAVVYGLVAIALFARAPAIAPWWPWPIEPVNIAMFSGQIAMFAVLPAFVIQDGSWRRLKPFLRFISLMAVSYLVLLTLPLGAYDWNRPLALPLMLMPVEWLATTLGLYFTHRGL